MSVQVNIPEIPKKNAKQSIMENLISDIYELPAIDTKDFLEWIMAEQQKPIRSCLEDPEYKTQRPKEHGLAESRWYVEKKSILRMRKLSASPFRSVEPGQFSRYLINYHSFFVRGERGFRNSAIGTLPDTNGNIVRYPSVKELNDFLISDRMKLYLECRQPERCIYIMAIVLILHPFADANGRVARAIFNDILYENFPKIGYIPIYELSYISNGGFLIAMRRLETYGDWRFLFRFVLNALSLVIRFQRKSFS